MSVLSTLLNPRSADFQASVVAMQKLVSDLRQTVDRIALGGPEAARQKHIARGKLLSRERVKTLIDPGSPFLELSQLAAYGMYGGVRSCRIDDQRNRSRQGCRMHDRRQRCDGQGRHLLPAHRQEAPARAGDRR